MGSPRVRWLLPTRGFSGEKEGGKLKAKEVRRELQRLRYRPSRAAYRLIKRHPQTWHSHGGIRTYRRSDGVTLVFTVREAAMLRRKELNRRYVEYHEARKAGLRRERVFAAVFTLLLGLPAAVLVLGTAIAVYYELWRTL